MAYDIPLERIDPDPEKQYDQATIDTLIQVLEADGLTPILVKPVDDRYQILDGNLRYHAAKQLERQTMAAELQWPEQEGVPLSLVLEIAKTFNEPNIETLHKVVDTLGDERTRNFFQQTQELEASGGMMTRNGKRRRTPGGAFFRLIRTEVKSWERKRIFGSPRANQAPPAKKAPVEPLPWAEAVKYANALLKHEKGPVRSVEVKLIGRPTKVVNMESCMVAMMENSTTPHSLPKGLPEPPEQPQSVTVFISNKQWRKASEELKASPQAALLVRGHPVFNPAKRMTMLLTQSAEVIERKRKKPKGQTA